MLRLLLFSALALLSSASLPSQTFVIDGHDCIIGVRDIVPLSALIKVND